MLHSARESTNKPKSPVQKKKAPEPLKHQLRNFSPWINRFGCSMFRRIARVSAGGNVAVASGALFVFVGALSRASSDEDMEETCDALFGRTPPNFDKLGKEMAKISDDNSAYKWLVVSTVYLPINRKLDPDLCQKLENKFGVKVQKLPAKDPPKAIEAINGYFREESENHLANMIATKKKTVQRYANGMVAAVGVYVHPWWSSRFERRATTEETFYEAEDKPVQVSMMHRVSTLPFVESDLCPGVVVRVVGIPCRNKNATVYFVLPANRFNLAEAVSHLTGDRASRLIEYCRPRRVRLSIPKVHMALKRELRKSLSSLGMDSWLNNQHPAFDGLTQRGGSVSLGQLYHQVMIKVNEDGDPGGAEEASDEDEVEFKCDQPFVIMFHHAATNAIWMLAQIKKPNVRGSSQSKQSKEESDSETKK